MAEPIYAPTYPGEVLTLRSPLDGENGTHGCRHTAFYHRFEWDDGRDVARSVVRASLDEPAFVVRKLSVTMTRTEELVDDSPAALIARPTAGDRQ